MSDERINPELRAEIAAALHRYEIRKAANKRWRERNPERVKAIRSAYNARRNAEDKSLRKLAKDLGMTN